jgi:hypothetical protein
MTGSKSTDPYSFIYRTSNNNPYSITNLENFLTTKSIIKIDFIIPTTPANFITLNIGNALGLQNLFQDVSEDITDFIIMIDPITHKCSIIHNKYNTSNQKTISQRTDSDDFGTPSPGYVKPINPDTALFCHVIIDRFDDPTLVIPSDISANISANNLNKLCHLMLEISTTGNGDNLTQLVNITTWYNDINLNNIVCTNRKDSTNNVTSINNIQITIS